MLRAFAAGEFSPTAAVEHALAVAEQTRESVNAFTEVYPQRALAAAAAAEKNYARGRARPLEGIPLAVKEEFQLAGTRRTSASLVFAERTDDNTDVYVQRLLDAGAIVIGKTTTPEFCLLGATHSKLFGITRNPWGGAYSCGGSSGGSAAALATGAAVLASGSDIGGSIRIPAAACGVVGYKPPYGRNPETAGCNLDYYSHLGPMARSVADCARMQAITAGQASSDIASLRDKPTLDWSNPPDFRGRKIAYSIDLGTYEIDREVAQNTQAAVRRFADLGAQTDEVNLHWPPDFALLGERYLEALWGAETAAMDDKHGEQLTSYARKMAAQHRRRSLADVVAANTAAVAMYQTFAPLMEKYDAFICPTLAITAPPADYGYPNLSFALNDEQRRGGEDKWCMTIAFNMLSRCPVLSVPSGMAASGIPTGIQIVGRAYHDEDVFLAGRALEESMGGFYQNGQLFGRALFS